VRCITLLTDFGLKDGYAGVLKGVIWKICPEAQIADLTHTVTPQNVMEGALALGRLTSYFPEGTVHVAVVDPGVGTHRRPVAMRLGAHYFVGPDNGLFGVVLAQAEARAETVEIVHLDRPEYWLPEVSNVFHGRDIFSPVAAHLANGVPLSVLGSPVTDPVRINIPRPEPVAKGWRGELIHIDAFGNVQANFQSEHLAGRKVARIVGKGFSLDRVCRTFGDGQVGELVAMIDSSDHLSIGVVNGSAQARLQAQVGDALEIWFEE
jgi:S-adenosylmethionine hydrolase